MDVLPVVLWTIVVAAIWVAALPVGTLLFGERGPAGTALALPIGFAILGVSGYWIGHLVWGWFGPVLALLSLVAVGGIAYANGGTIHVPRGALVVFLVAAGAMVLIRGVDPAIHPQGGEKFLDFGLIQAVLRADTLPPEDFWFAGRPVRYYYGGSILAATLTRLSTVPAGIAYNLTLATVFGALAVAAYGLGAAITTGSGRTDPRVAGGVAAFFVVAAGNLATPLRIIAPRALPLDFVREWGHVLYDGIRAPYGDVVASYATEYSYWYARYVIPGTADVFPAWTFLNGDLRPHMLSAPFLVLVAALAFGVYRTPANATRRRWLFLLATGVLGAYLTVTNMWTLPTVVGLTWLSVATADAAPQTLYPPWLHPRLPQPTGVTGELHRIIFATPIAGGVGLIASIGAAPYLLFHTPINRGIGILPPGSEVGGLLLVHGIFLAVFILWIGPRLGSVIGDRSRTAAIIGATLVLAALTIVAGYPALGLFLPLTIAALALVRYADGGYALLLVAAGATLVIVMEFVYAKVYPFDPNAPRWNTVYKVYHQVWIVWGVAAGVALATQLERVRARFSAATDWRAATRPAVTGVIVVAIVVAAATFPAAALGAHFVDERQHPTDIDLSLDGLAYVDDSHPDIAPAIDYIDDLDGTPTIVTKPGVTIYSWTNAPSSLTGVPTVLGWDHEIGYRGQDAWSERLRAVRLLYSGDAEITAAIIDEYDVDYIYVGPRERAAYPTWDYSRLDGVTVAFQNDAVTIYTVTDDGNA